MKFSIRLKLLIGFTLLLFAAFVVQGFIYVAAKDYIHAQIDSMQKAEAKLGAEVVKHFFTDLNENSNGLAQAYQKNPQQIGHAAQYLLETNNYIKKITILSLTGRELQKFSLFSKESSDNQLTYEVISEPFAVASKGTAAMSKVYYREEGLAPHIDLFTPVRGTNASSSGVIKMRVNLYQVKKELASLKIGESGFVYVVDNEGRLIAHNSNEYVLERPNLLSRKVIADALAEKQTSHEDQEYVNEKNVTVVAKAVKISGIDWVAVLEQPKVEAYAFLTTLQNLFIVTFLGSIVLLLLIALYLSENLTRPIRRLERSAQQIERGQGKKTEIIKTGDEIESLSKSFASMTDLLMQRDQWLEKVTLKLNDTNEKLKQMDKLKSDFVSVASHELRTPMTAIKSYLSMALDGMGGQLTEKQRFYLDRAYISSDRLIEMVNDMLNISRIESGRLTLVMAEVHIEKIAQEVIDDVNPRAAELGVSVSLQDGVTPPSVIADYDKIKEVLFNLVGNSLKFTPKTGKITISFAVTETTVEVKVSDTGNGIEPENLPKLFQKFGLLPGSYKSGIAGTGLGLYICKSIIELHEGKISAASQGGGKGAEFVFSLKIYNEEDLKRLSAKYAHDSSQAVDLIHSKV